MTAKSGKEVRSRRDKVRKPLDKHLEPKQKHMSREAYDEEIERLLDADDYVGAEQLKATYEMQVEGSRCNTLGEPMPSATTAGVCGRTYLRIATPRNIGEEVLAWQASQGCQRRPNRRSDDEYEKKLGKRFHDVLRRRYCAIGDRPCQQLLSVDEVDFINGIPQDGCPVNIASSGVLGADVLIEEPVKRRRLLSKTRVGVLSAQVSCASPRGERRKAVELQVAQSTTGEAVPVAAELIQLQRWERLVLAIRERHVDRSKGTEQMKERCYICHTKTENPQRLPRASECPYIACSLGCLNDLHCKWIEIKAEAAGSISRPPWTRTTEGPRKEMGHPALEARGSFEQKHKEMARGSRVPNSWFQANE